MTISILKMRRGRPVSHEYHFVPQYKDLESMHRETTKHKPVRTLAPISLFVSSQAND